MKDKYVFDPDRLDYRAVNKSVKYKVLRVISWVIGSALLAVIIILLFELVFDTPSERQQRQENRMIAHDLKKLEERYERIDTVLKELSYIDLNIYRTIFGAEPVANDDSIYKSRIEVLELLSQDNKSIVTAAKQDIDGIMSGINLNAMGYVNLQDKVRDLSSSLERIPAIQPIRNPDLTRLASGYGNRMHPLYKIEKFHSGMDFTAPTGTEVFATADGKVVDVNKTGRGHGNTIVINHENRYKTVYSHLDRFNVRIGNNVKRGDIIGWVGNSGLSTAPHLHYEVLLDDKPVNPVNFFFLELSPIEYNKMVELSIKSGQSFD